LVFLGLEILSISLYVLTGYHSKRIESGEAAIKYFVLGAFSSAFFLYGVALIYGATGSTNLAAIASFLATNDVTSNGVLLAGSALLLVGLGFKVAAVPFHVWTPDVYQGAPTPATAFMAAVAKAAGFAALLRIFLSALPTQSQDWQIPVGALCVLTLLVGAVLAVVQTDVKRMMAYSSISHAGYILLGLWVASQQGGGGESFPGLAGSLFYILAYTFMVAVTFGIIMLVGGSGDSRHNLDDYRGLARQRPALALALTVLLISQAGIPFTTGFFAKFYVIGGAVEIGSLWGYILGVVAMVAAVIATFFYLRIILATYSAPPSESDEADEPAVSEGSVAVATRTAVVARVPATVTVAVGLSVAFTVAFGLDPAPILHFAEKATLLF
jgi:NADH-quinone oxidoreductase subunit N